MLVNTWLMILAALGMMSFLPYAFDEYVTGTSIDGNLLIFISYVQCINQIFKGTSFTLLLKSVPNRNSSL